MADTINNQTTGAVFIPEIWGGKVLTQRESKLVAAKVVERYDDEVSGFGDTIHLPEVSNLSATEVSPGTDVTYQANTETDKQIVVNEHWESSFLIHDRLSAQAKYRVADKNAKKSAYALASKMDSKVLTEYSNAGSNVGDGSTNITKANLLVAVRTLDGNDVPTDDRHFIIDEYGKHDLFGIDDFIRYDATGKVSPAVSGERQGSDFGELYGLTVHVSTNVPVETASPNVIHGLMLQREAIGLAVQKGIKVEKARMPSKLADLVTAQVLFGVKTLRADHMIDFRYKQG